MDKERSQGAGETAPAGKAGGEERSLGQAAARGLLWLVAQSLVARLSGVLSQIVLAWLLLPADFGKIGLALTISSLAATLVSFGIDDVLLQLQRRMRFWIAPAFWTSLALGLAGLVLIVAVAPVAAAAYGSPDLTSLTWILAAAIPIGSLSTVPAVMIRAALDLRFLALFNASETMAIQGLTILLAWLGAGPYSFVIPVPVLAVAKAAIFWHRARLRITGGRRLRPRQVRSLLASGAMVSGNRLLIEAVGQGDYIVLGLLTSPDVVGLYFFAFRLAAMPVRTLAGSFQNVMFPVLAKLGGEPERQKRAALEAARLLAAIVVPLCFLQAALAEPVLHVLFGAKWEGAILLAQVLSLGLPFDAVSWVAGALMSARGEFRRSLLYGSISAPLFFVAVVLGGVAAAPLGVAVAVTLYYVVAPTTVTWLVLRSPTISARTVVAFYGLPAAMAALAVGTAYLASFVSPLTGHPLARILLITALSSVLYGTLLRTLMRSVFDQLLARARTTLLSRRPTAAAPATGA